ncbi:MAG: DUF1616 domain-containing protein [Methanobacteriota archaeon]
MSLPDRHDHLIDTFYSVFFETKFFPDLKLVIIWLIGSVMCIYLPILNTSPLRVVFALPMVLFIPGYVLIASLFPGIDDIDLIERIALSFGLSIAVVPLTGLALNYTPWGIRLDPIVISLYLLTVGLILIAQYRRALLPEGQRYGFPGEAMIQGVRDEFFPLECSRTDRILSIVLLVAVIAAIGTTVFVIVVPKEGEKFTEFYILGEKKMAADYPDQMDVGEKYPLYIGVGNHEYRNVTYTVETQMLMMNFDDRTNISTISKMVLLDRIPVDLGHNQTVITQYNLTAPTTGYNRVEFLLFNESVPGENVSGMDRINASYRDVHLWVKISGEKYNFSMIE